MWYCYSPECYSHSLADCNEQGHRPDLAASCYCCRCDQAAGTAPTPLIFSRTSSKLQPPLRLRIPSFSRPNPTQLPPRRPAGAGAGAVPFTASAWTLDFGPYTHLDLQVFPPILPGALRQSQLPHTQLPARVSQPQPALLARAGRTGDTPFHHGRGRRGHPGAGAPR